MNKFITFSIVCTFLPGVQHQCTSALQENRSTRETEGKPRKVMMMAMAASVSYIKESTFTMQSKYVLQFLFIKVANIVSLSCCRLFWLISNLLLLLLSTTATKVPILAFTNTIRQPERMSCKCDYCWQKQLEVQMRAHVRYLISFTFHI